MPGILSNNKRKGLSPELLLTGAVYLLGIYAINILLLSGGFIIRAGFLIKYSLLCTLAVAVLSAPVYAKYTSQKIGIVSKVLLLVILVLSVCFFITASVYDSSSDGQTYHLQTVAKIAEGWNPARETLSASQANDIFIQHYAKGYEYAAYSVYALTGQAEGGKMFNLLLMLASALVLIYAASVSKINIPAKTKYLLILLIVCNPVSVFQLFTFYVDGQVSSCIIILLTALFIYKQTPLNAKIIMFFATVILVTLKFTGLIYAALILLFGIIIIGRIYRTTVLRYSINALIFIIIAVAMAGFNPYIKNTLDNGNPFYPLMGKNKINIMTGTNAPASFAEKNIFEKVAEANLARSRNVHGSTICPEPELKTPFTFNINEWIVFKSHDVRMGGFGPLWSGVLLLSGIGIVLGFRNAGSQKDIILPVSLVIIFILLTILINPEGWYARYAPQFWLIPVCICLVLSVAASGKLKVLFKITLFVMVLNLAGTSLVSIGSDIILSQEIKSEMQYLKESKLPVSVVFNAYDANKLRMDRYHIPYKEISQQEQTAFNDKNYTGMTIINSMTEVYLPVVMSPYKPKGLFKVLSSYVNAGQHGN